MRTSSQGFPTARLAAIAGVSALALAAGGWQYNRTALAEFDQAAGAETWLVPARSELSLLDRVKIPWLDRAGIVSLTGPRAIRRLAADPFVIDGMAAARRAVATFNQIGVGCGVLARYRRIEECSGGASAARFRRIDDNFRGSALDRDHYVALSGIVMSLVDKIRFSTELCNYYPAPAEMMLAVTYHSTDRLPSETVRRTVAPGDCVVPFDRKLRHAPALRGGGRASPPARLASAGEPGLVWNEAIAISDQRSRRAWALADARLCYTAPQATCGGVRIGNPRAYARALAASLANDAKIAQRGPDPLFKFTIGAALAGPAAAGEFGAYVLSVAPGGPAAALGLSPGDRIVAVGDKLTFTHADVMLAMDEHGARHGRRAALAIEIVRDGEVLRGHVALAFYRPYWDKRGYNRWWAAIRGLLGAASLGTAGPIVCGARSLMGWKSPEGLPETYDECRARWALEGEAIAELYRGGYIIGSFVGSLVSPLTLIVPRFLRVAPLFGSMRAGRIAHGIALSVIQQSVSTIASARPGTTAGEMLSDIQVSLPRTIAMGAAESLLDPGFQ